MRKLEKQMFTKNKIFTYDGNYFSFILTKHYFIEREQIMKGKNQSQTDIKDKSCTTQKFVTRIAATKEMPALRNYQRKQFYCNKKYQKSFKERNKNPLINAIFLN